MNHPVYLAVMLGVILVIAALVIPSLVRKKCSACGARNSLDAKACTTCNAPFPDDD